MKAEITRKDATAMLMQEAPDWEALHARYVAWLDVSDKTRSTYDRALRPLFSFLVQKGITRPTREDMLAYKQSLIAQEKKPATVTSYITAARLFFSWIESETGCPNPCAHVKGMKQERGFKKDYMTSSQIGSVLNEIGQSEKDLRDRAILLLMSVCALRCIEVSRAECGDLRVRGEKTVLYVHGKGRDESMEFVIVPAEVEAAIRAYWKKRRSSTGPMFTSTSNNGRGQAMTTRSVSGAIKARLIAAGYDCDRLSAHSLRHSAVTMAVLGGESVEAVQMFARHKNIATTLIYNHVLDAEKNTCAQSVAQALFQTTEA